MAWFWLIKKIRAYELRTDADRFQFLCDCWTVVYACVDESMGAHTEERSTGHCV